MTDLEKTKAVLERAGLPDTVSETVATILLEVIQAERQECAKVADAEAARWQKLSASHTKSNDVQAASRAASREHSAMTIADCIRARK